MAPASPIRLVIFDCDGVLVDSEPIAMRVLLAAIERAGVSIPPEFGFRNYLGRSFSSVALSLDDVHGLRLDTTAVDAMRNDLYAAYRRELKPMAGLLDALPALKAPFCVASSSQLERITISLEITGLMERFNPPLYSATMVERGKPAPDLFLHAAASMGVSPADCVVVEDSPAGIIAAKKAGMRVFAFTGGSHIAPSGLAQLIGDLKPDHLFSDMSELPGLIERAEAVERAEEPLLVAVDVGTGSARAGVVTSTGRLLARAEFPIAMRRTDADHAEHDSTQIWQAVCAAVRGARAEARVSAERIRGISFDATCSLVVRDRAGAPISLDTGDDSWDTIVWLDHRAQAEAAECTATGDAVLDTVGGVMSPEMEVPKLMWLKRHAPDVWNRAGLFFDLADYLTWMASGSLARSQCTLTCKWTWIGERGGWQLDFLRDVSLDDLLERGGLPQSAAPIGSDAGQLTPAAAEALGLTQACRVGVGLIDAHAGALGSLAEFAGDPGSIHRHLALIAGTSSCVMALSADPRPMHGAWGPFAGAVLPDIWLNDAGQSATGALLDHLLQWHSAGGEPTPELHARVATRIAELRHDDGPAFGQELHVIPDFHGNRSPLADPGALGVISGLNLESDFDSLCKLYWRACVGIAMGVRHILEALRAKGYAATTLHVAGGHTRNPLLMELYADATGCTVVEPQQDATLLGTAIAAATAGGLYGSLSSAAIAMQQEGRIRLPQKEAQASYDRDYQVYLAMIRHRAEIDSIVRANQAPGG